MAVKEAETPKKPQVEKKMGWIQGVLVSRYLGQNEVIYYYIRSYKHTTINNKTKA